MLFNIFIVSKILTTMISISSNTVFFKDNTKYLYPIDFVASPEWVKITKKS